MNLTEELKAMKKKGRQVVSIDYVLKALRSTESDSKSNLDHLPVQDTKGA